MSTAAAPVPAVTSTTSPSVVVDVDGGCKCPICATATTTEFHRDTGKKSAKRPYLLCPRCFCIFVPPAHHIKPTVEKTRYDNHNNNCEDAGYQTFLSQCMRPLVMLLAQRLLQISGASSETAPYLNLAAEDDQPEDKDYFAMNNNNNCDDDSKSNATSVKRGRKFALARCFLPKFEEGLDEMIVSAEKAIVTAAIEVAAQLFKSSSNSAPATPVQVIGNKEKKVSCNKINEDDDDDRPSSAFRFTGLDFGCGPGPCLSKMMEQRYAAFVQSPILLYDKFYYPNEDVWTVSPCPATAAAAAAAAVATSSPARRERKEDEEKEEREHGENCKGAAAESKEANDAQREKRLFDFITATEVAEHIADAGAVLTQLWSHVRPNGGILAVQTSRTEGCCGFKEQAQQQQSQPQQQRPAHGVDVTRFANWHYTRDDTHITYFHLESFRFLRDRWNHAEGMKVRHMFRCGPSVIIFVKQ